MYRSWRKEWNKINLRSEPIMHDNDDDEGNYDDEGNHDDDEGNDDEDDNNDDGDGNEDYDNCCQAVQ